MRGDQQEVHDNITFANTNFFTKRREITSGQKMYYN